MLLGRPVGDTGADNCLGRGDSVERSLLDALESLGRGRLSWRPTSKAACGRRLGPPATAPVSPNRVVISSPTRATTRKAACGLKRRGDAEDLSGAGPDGVGALCSCAVGGPQPPCLFSGPPAGGLSKVLPSLLGVALARHDGPGTRCWKCRTLCRCRRSDDHPRWRETRTDARQEPHEASSLAKGDFGPRRLYTSRLREPPARPLWGWREGGVKVT